MKRTLLKSKIHMASVTEANLNYYGSISIDKDLCQQADLLPFEKVEIYNCNNGSRFATYVILGEKGEICVNGAAARHVQTGDVIIIASYAQYKHKELEKHNPRLVFVDQTNQVKEVKGYIDSSINKKVG